MSLNAILPEAVALPPRAKPFRAAWSRSLKNANAPFIGTPLDSTLIWSILTTSAALHLLLIGFLGAGVPKPAPVRTKPVVPPPSAVQLVENVKLEPEPETQLPEQLKSEELPLQTEPPAAASVDLPPVSELTPIAAVSASVPVAFGIDVKGPVRLVSDPSQASGRVGGRRGPVPVSLDDTLGAKDLLLPQIVYPAAAQVRRQSGTVLIEFHTTPTGDITTPKIYASSGYPALDSAALENLKHGRWVGAAGYYLKAYLFKLN
jgi:TonB family protein